MYARMSRFSGLPPERIEATIREFEEGQLKALEQQPGYKGVLVGVDRAEGKAIAMTFWETAENLRETPTGRVRRRSTPSSRRGRRSSIATRW
jgi:heme-degrading monooxygenase HmoA